MTQRPTLDLSTLVDRPCIRVDGETYDLHHPDEFSLLDRMTLFQRYQQAMEASQAVTSSDDPAAMRAAAERATTLLDEACRSVLVPTPEVEALHAKLRDTHRVEILRSFTTLLSADPATAEATPASGTTPGTTGASWSPDSSASTAAAIPVAG